MTIRKFLVLFSVVIFSPVGDAFLARGMKQTGAIDVHHLTHVLAAVASPWIILGIACLIAGMANYMTALSFADLTFVLPATAFGYVTMVLIAHFWLGEHVSLVRWAGILLIVMGVGVVARGPSRTGETGEALYAAAGREESE
ncbi:MAG TPA: EamA family transporter [Acidobacteriaceae bacterium]|nr:EamA family transporter [Acidobacteriaceae bacterium]